MLMSGKHELVWWRAVETRRKSQSNYITFYMAHSHPFFPSPSVFLIFFPVTPPQFLPIPFLCSSGKNQKCRNTLSQQAASTSTHTSDTDTHGQLWQHSSNGNSCRTNQLLFYSRNLQRRTFTRQKKCFMIIMFKVQYI